MNERQNKATLVSIDLGYTSFFDSRASRVKPASMDYSVAVRRHYESLIARYFPGDTASFLHMGWTEYIPLIPIHIIKHLYAYTDALKDGLASASKRMGSIMNAMSWIFERLEVIDTCLPPQSEPVVRVMRDVHYTMDRYFDRLSEVGTAKISELANQIKKDLKPLFFAIENHQRVTMRRQIVTVLDKVKTLDGVLRLKASTASRTADAAEKPRTKTSADKRRTPVAAKTGAAKAKPDAKAPAKGAKSAGAVNRPKKFMQEQLNTFVEYMTGRAFDGNRPMLNLFARDCWLEHKREWDKAAKLTRENVGKGYGRFYDLATAYWGWLGRHRQPVPDMK